MLIDLVKDVIPEQLDDIPIARFRPAGIPCKPVVRSRIESILYRLTAKAKKEKTRRDVLWPFINEPELAHKSEQTRVLEFAHKLILKSISSPGSEDIVNQYKQHSFRRECHT
jgi:hypothetical protein